MQKVGQVLLPDYRQRAAPGRLLVAQDCFELLEGEGAAALADAVNIVARQFESQEPVRVSPDGPDKWMPHFRTLQMADIWRAHGAWIERAKPNFGPGVAERFAACATITPAAVTESGEVRDTVRQHLVDLLDGDGVLCLPTAPGIAPLVETPEAALDNFRWRAMGLTSDQSAPGQPGWLPPGPVIAGRAWLR
jgi:amidase